jgi:uncharacterized repeat protein (TIGR01451 family)
MEFEIVITNRSPVDDVTVVDVADVTIAGDVDLSDVCGLPVTLVVGESLSCVFTRTIEGDAGDTDTDTVRVGGFDDDGNAVSAEGDATVEVITVSDLAVAKSIDGQLVPGDEAAYVIDVSNDGPSPTASVTTVVDELPPGATLVEATGPGWDCSASTDAEVRCTTEAVVDAGSAFGAVTVLVDLDPSLVGELTNVVTVDNGDDPTATGDETTDPLAPEADLELQKTADVRAVEPGDIVHYTVELANAGPSDAVDVEIAEDLPSGLSLSDHDADTGSFDPATGTWTVERLAAGETAVLQIWAEALATGDHDNQVFVTASGVIDPDSEPGAPAGEDDESVAGLVVGFLDDRTVDDPPPDDRTGDDPPPDDADPLDPASEGEPGVVEGFLPRTGADLIRFAVIGAMLVLAGAALARRRRPW